jgi:hypothetical protein
MTDHMLENPRAAPTKWRTPAEVREDSNPQQSIYGGCWGPGQSDPKHPRVARKEPTTSENEPRPDVARRQGGLARWDEEGGATERSR